MFGFNRNDFKLIVNFFKIAVHDKYAGSGLGSFWAIANPLLMMGIYTFVFVFVFKARLPGASTTLSYTNWLISGYGPWLATSDALMAATMSIVSSSGIVKNMVFKTEILPISYALTAIVPLIVSLIFLVFMLFFDKNIPTWHILLIVPLIALQFIFMIALGFFLATITVFVRDLGIVLPNVLMITLFMTPIFYPVNAMPFIIRELTYINPFFIFASSYRDFLIDHSLPNVWEIVYLVVLSSILWFYGLKFFRRAKGYFISAL